MLVPHGCCRAKQETLFGEGRGEEAKPQEGEKELGQEAYVRTQASAH